MLQTIENGYQKMVEYMVAVFFFLLVVGYNNGTKKDARASNHILKVAFREFWGFFFWSDIFRGENSDTLIKNCHKDFYEFSTCFDF